MKFYSNFTVSSYSIISIFAFIIFYIISLSVCYSQEIHEIAINSFTGDQNFDSENIKYYRFQLNEPTSIALISTGNVNLKGTLYELLSGTSVNYAPNMDHDGSDDHAIHSYTDINGRRRENFIIRPGNWQQDEWSVGCEGSGYQREFEGYRVLNSGVYQLYVEPDDNTQTEGTYGILFLKRPETTEEFFLTLQLLVNDEDTSNDFLDIYFQALFPEVYDSGWNQSGNNWAGNTINDDAGVNWSRQCKALSNVYLLYILKDCHLQTDDHIYYWGHQIDCILGFEFSKMLYPSTSTLDFNANYLTLPVICKFQF